MPDFVISPCQKYVQDVLREQLSERVYQCLREEGGHIYVCGDVTMAGDVLKNVQQIIKQEGNMSLEDAGLFISRLRVRQMVAVLGKCCSSLKLQLKHKSMQLLHTCKSVARKSTISISSKKETKKHQSAFIKSS